MVNKDGAITRRTPFSRSSGWMVWPRWVHRNSLVFISPNSMWFPSCVILGHLNSLSFNFLLGNTLSFGGLLSILNELIMQSIKHCQLFQTVNSIWPPVWPWISSSTCLKWGSFSVKNRPEISFFLDLAAEQRWKWLPLPISARPDLVENQTNWILFSIPTGRSMCRGHSCSANYWPLSWTF